MRNMKGICYIDSNVFLYPVLYEDLPEVEFFRDVISSIEKRIHKRTPQHSLGMRYLTLFGNS